ncbi:MAG: hypothetical protein NZ108_04470, partial [Bacteroidia bacterium]|nr:hypothetical protein [Bacteroidia bacterium]
MKLKIIHLITCLLLAAGVAKAQGYKENDPVFQQRVQDKITATQQFLASPGSTGGGGMYPLLSPEQDCGNAIPVCTGFYQQNVSYSGPGSIVDIPGGITCLGTGETNSVWYIFTVQNSGTF